MSLFKEIVGLTICGTGLALIVSIIGVVCGVFEWEDFFKVLGIFALGQFMLMATFAIEMTRLNARRDRDRN